MPNIGQLVLFLIKSAEGSPLERFSMPICHDVHKLSSSKKPSVQVLFWAVTWLEAHLQHMFPDQWRNLFMLPYFRSAVRIKHHCIGYLSQQFHRGRGKGPMLALAARVCYLPMASRYWLQAHADWAHKLSWGGVGTAPLIPTFGLVRRPSPFQLLSSGACALFLVVAKPSSCADALQNAEVPVHRSIFVTKQDTVCN